MRTRNKGPGDVGYCRVIDLGVDYVERCTGGMRPYSNGSPRSSGRGRHGVTAGYGRAATARTPYKSVYYTAASVYGTSGALIVSDAIDCSVDSTLLCEFLWRFDHCSDAQRGHDMTVTRATEGQETRFRTAIWAYHSDVLKYSTEATERALEEHYLPGRVVVVTVDSECPSSLTGGPSSEPSIPPADAATPPSGTTHPSGKKTQNRTTGSRTSYLIGRPVVTPASLVGRCTRGFWSVTVDQGSPPSVGLLKDTWRERVNGMDKEGDIVQKLNAEGVGRIPIVGQHGDVVDGENVNQVQDTRIRGSLDRSCWATLPLTFARPTLTWGA